VRERTIQSPRDLRRSNRSLLLRRLYFDGPLSRQDMIDTMGLSAASVSNVVADLVGDGVVVEAGIAGSGGGRPRTLLRVGTEDRFVVGVDVAETRIRIKLLTLDLRPRAGVEIPLPDGCGDAGVVVRAIAEGLREVTASAGAGRRPIAPEAILGVGVGVPAVVEHRPEAVVYGQTVGWDGIPLERMLREQIDLPLFIDNVATALGQAEMWFGAGRGCSDAVVALIGVGIGACVITDGEPYRGVGRSAGEWGHTVVEVGGRRCRCGAIGCLEAYAGVGAIRERYRELVADAVLRREGFDALDEPAALAAIIAAADGPRPRAEAIAVLDEAAVYLGAGIASLINLFNPERILLGGWAGLVLGPRLLPRVRQVAAGYALRHAFRSTEIGLCGLGPDAVARGAGTLPVAAFLSSGGARSHRAMRAEARVG
jgi:predicted NBD/HSP70 family sugar kinase